METSLTLYGFDGSTYVRTIKMLLAAKEAAFEQVPINVLTGEPREAAHRVRHPFGKVPVLDHGDLRLLETDAIASYLDEILPGPSFTPGNPEGRAQMRMAMGIYDSYGYTALLGVAGAHLFPDFIGNPTKVQHAIAVAESQKVLTFLMSITRGSTFLCGETPTLADLYLAPACAYVAMTPDAVEVFAVDGFSQWWAAVQELSVFVSTSPEA